MKRGMLMGALLAGGLVYPAWAHAPLLDCYENGDGTITCEAGYSDGTSAAGQTIRVRDQNNRLLIEARFGDDGTYTFEQPDVPEYRVQFEGDAAHSVEMYSLDIVAAY